MFRSKLLMANISGTRLARVQRTCHSNLHCLPVDKGLSWEEHDLSPFRNGQDASFNKAHRKYAAFLIDVYENNK